MKLTILGGTGPLGQQVVKQALEQGHQVNVVLRTLEKLPEDVRNNPKFSHSTASIFNADELSASLQGSDIIMSCLGVAGGAYPFTKINLYSDSGKSIASAMQKQDIKRFVACTSWCTEYHSSHPKFIEWFLKPMLIGRHLTNMAVMEKYFIEETDIDYTFVRPPGLTDNPMTDKPVESVEGQFVKDCEAQMPRANVAKFMLSSFGDQSWVKKCVAIGVKK